MSDSYSTIRSNIIRVAFENLYQEQIEWAQQQSDQFTAEQIERKLMSEFDIPAIIATAIITYIDPRAAYESFQIHQTLNEVFNK